MPDHAIKTMNDLARKERIEGKFQVHDAIDDDYNVDEKLVDSEQVKKIYVI